MSFGNSISNSNKDYLLKLQEAALNKLSQSKTDSKSSNPILFSSGSDMATQTLESIEASFLESEEALKASQESDETQSVSSTQALMPSTEVDDKTPAGPESQKIREEIEKLEQEKEDNLEKMEEIEDEIEDLAKEAEENIAAAIAAQKSEIKEHEEESKKVVQQNVNEYISANKEGGKGMTKDELQGNIKDSLSSVPEVADAVAALVAANEQIAEIDTCLGELNDLIGDTKALECKIDAKEQEFQAVKQAEEAAKKCDPIGFTIGEGAEQAQYDFIIDDGSFDSTTDFLGAQNQWNEMESLDTDGDQMVTTAELQAANIKAVKTTADGSQEVVDLKDEFGEDFSIDLASYEKGGSHNAVDAESDKDNDGVKDQELLGTFSVNANGQQVSGYNTLDDTDWLAENFGLNADVTENLDEIEYSEDLKPHVDFFDLYTDKSQELKESLRDAWETIGLTDCVMNQLNDVAVEKGSEKAHDFFKTIDLNERDEYEETIIEESEDGLDNPKLEDNKIDVSKAEVMSDNEKEDYIKSEIL